MSEFKQQELFWEKLFSVEDSLTTFPYYSHTKKRLSESTVYNQKFIDSTLSSDVSKRIMNMSNRSHMAIYMILLAGVECLLHKYTYEQDMILGVPAIELDKDQTYSSKFLILKNNITPKSSFKSLFNQIKLSISESIEHQGLPFRKMVQNLNLQYDSNNLPVINTMVSLQELHSFNYNDSVVSDTIFHFELGEEDSINLKLAYNENYYDKDYIVQLIENLNYIFSVILYQPELEIDKFETVAEIKKNKLLFEFNDTAVEYPHEKTVYQLFEEQVERTPDHLAVVFEDQQLTYCELNERANQLARTLRKEGVQADRLVGIIAKHSLEMVVGILAVSKAGGAYVPIDPQYPEERIQYMLEDSKARIVLVNGDVHPPLSYDGVIISLSESQSYDKQTTNLEPISHGKDLAYVIYTSGSTGNPKGVLIEHQGLTNYIWWAREVYVQGEKTNFPLYSSISFDLTVTSVFTPLITGNTILVYDGEDKAALIPTIMQDSRVDIIKLTPAHLHILKEMNLAEYTTVQKMIVGGENLSAKLARDVSEQSDGRISIYNEYGPTETVVGCMIYRYDPAEDRREYVPIGKPAANTSIYLLDPKLNLAPTGVQGELYIAGDGVARGYLNQPGLTAEKFVENPFIPGERMYKTGDLAKWLPDGNIEYIGRIDDQVKIRGYRIELGEVESVLQKVELVQEAVVVTRENENGLKQLCAYFVGDESLTVGQLREAMSQELPEYMIPSYFVQLVQMPLTQNGKIDRKALSALEGNLQTGTEYVAPQTPIEEMLVSIWQTVLGVPQIGVLDNFFDLGGDSIKSIQVSSRLYQAGYRVDMKNLFKYSTVASLSPHVEKITRVAEQGEVTGEAMLTPIQHWFFDREVTAPHHFNQAFMLYRKQGFDVSALRKTMQKITEHHDALRMVFRQTEQGYEAWNRGIEEEELFSLEVMDLIGNGNPVSAIEEAVNTMQRSIDLSEGPLMKLGLFQCEEGDHLLIVIHHLVVDGVSWRILLEDIEAGYDQAVSGEVIQLPQKTDSFQLWAEQLSLYASSLEMEKEREYWNEIEQIPTGLLPKDEEQDCGLIKDSEAITVQWTASETEQLLKQTSRAYNTEINDLLLTALGTAIHQWTGMENIIVNLEGHGRESILSDLDITRTVGWFTSQYPVVLPIETGSDISHRIKNIKEGLRHIPNKGIGYGLLKYLSENQEKQTFTLKPEISFNYLGQFDQDLENTAMQPSTYSSGETESKHHARSYVLDINGMISGGRLSLEINYNGKQYRRETIEQLANGLQSSLQEVIEHCVTKERAELTPSDIIFKGMTIEALDHVVQEMQHIGEIENVYPLTPMQKGMLFHSLMNPQSEAYFEQATFDVQGSMNIEAFAQSLEQLVQRHAIFRTNFVNAGNDEPLQIVYRNRKIDFHYEDLHEMQESSREEWVKKYTSEDKERGFNLAEDALMRMMILRTEEQTYRVIWSFHHILMDGWCIPLVTQEIFEIYYAIQQQREPELSVVTPYSDYIEWLEAQNHGEASKYWNDYLDGYEGQTLLPQVTSSNENENYISGSLVWNLGKELTEQLKQVANGNQVTLNTLMQTAWGVLLQRYNNSTDVVFGSVVSGRPSEILGVENIIGLFINTIPVRIRGEAEDSFVEVMKRNQKQAVASHAYDTHPLYEIQAQTEQKQDLITHIMVFENYPLEQQLEHSENRSETDLIIENVSMTEQTNYDFNVTVIPGEEIQMQFQYNAHIYDDASIERMRNHLIQIIRQVVNNPQTCIHELELVTAEEKIQILEMFNDTAAEYPREKTIHQLFEEQVERTPDHVAVVFENQQLTYRELNARANQLARTLRNEGVQEDQLVGVMVERSIELIVGILGILKAGGAYVPLDPEYPEERIQYILEDAGVKVLLLQQHLQGHVVFKGKYINLDDISLYDKDDSNLEISTRPSGLAFVIYTSGSTGKPKGVLVEHHSVLNFLQTLEARTLLDDKDIVLQKSTISSDASIWEIFWGMMKGARLYLLEPGGEKDPATLVRAVQSYKVTHLEFVPSMLQAFVDYVENFTNVETLASLRYVSVGGEKLSAHLADKFHKVLTVPNGTLLHNTYGPTEATVEVTSFVCSEAGKYENIPIGKPNLNTQMYILNDKLQIQPIGVAGELYTGGVGVARGYLNRPELTAEKFVENPFIPGERMYRTGDLAKWLPDGNIEYIGRIDHQVKIRGYRVELGEVESALQKVDLVREAIVVARESTDGLIQLCAYFVGDESLTVGQLREAMAQELPDYMIPSYFVQLMQMPLTPNGKIDRKALPEPEGILQTGIEYVAPRTRIEEQLVEIWKEVLFNNHIGVKDNFFDVGGHSLRATTLVSKIHKQMNINVMVRDVFRYQTVEQMAEFITGIEEQTYLSIPVTPRRTYYPVSSTQKRMYILSQLEGGELSYNMPGAMIVEGELDSARVEEAFQNLIQRHESLRTSFEMIQGEPVQHIHPEVMFSLEKIQAEKEEIDTHIDRFVRPFNLQEAPLLRVGLIEIRKDYHVLLFDIHHIISDGVSTNLIIKEFIQLYEGESQPPLRIQYKDYAVWQQSEMQSERMRKQEAYWLNMFDGEIPELELPIDYERPSVRSYEGDIVEFTIDKQISDGLKELEKQTGATLYMVLLAAYTTLLAKYSGQEDIIVGTPIAGRTHADLEPIIGMFVNTLAIRNYPVGDKTFYTYVQEVKETMLNAYENQEYPFEELVQKVNIKRDMSRNPIFDTMFVLQNIEETELQIENLVFKPYVRDHTIAKFDLALYVSFDGEQLKCNFEFCKKIFKDKTIHRLSQDLLLLLSKFSDHPHMKLIDINLNQVDEDSLGLIEFSF